MKITIKGISLIFYFVSASFAFGQAPTVATPTVTSITNNSATLGGNVTTGAGITARGTRWKTTTPVGTSNSSNEGGTSTGIFSHSRSSLTPGSKIYYTAFATNGSGTGTTPDDGTVFFFTLSNEPTTNPTLTATASSASQINLTYSSISASGYVVLRKQGSAPSTAGLVDGSAPGGVDFITTVLPGSSPYNDMTGLSAGLDYHYKLVPFNWNGSDPETYNYYLTSNPNSSDYTFSDLPSANYTGTLTATGSANNQIDLIFTDATTVPLTSTSGYIVLRKQGGNPTTASLNSGSVPTSATDYLATINGTGISSYNDISGLSAKTEYRYALIPFNWDGVNNGTYNYNLTAGFTVAAGFTYANEPSSNPTLSATATSSTQINLTYSNISADGYVILRKQGSAPSAAGLLDGTAPGGVDFVTTVTSNSSPFNNSTGLSAGLEYFYTLVPFNWDGSNDGTYNYYLTSNPTASDFTFSSAPSSNYTGTITGIGISSSQIDLSFSSISSETITNAVGYVVLRRQGSNPTTASLNDGEDPSGATYYHGTITGTAISTYSDLVSVSAQTPYRYALVPFNWDGVSTETYNYTTPVGTIATAYSLSNEPSAHPAVFTATATSGTQINLAFSAANSITNADGYIILRRTDGTFPTATGVDDGVAPGSLTLEPGTTRITTITGGSTTTFPNSGLSSGTQYNYAIIPYNSDGSNNETYNYRTSATILTDFDAPSNGVSISGPSASLCPGNYFPLGSPITISEVSKSDFSDGASAVTLILEMNDLAYSFEAGTGTVSINPGPPGGASTDIASISMVVNASRITVTYTLDGNNNKKDEIVISGIKVNNDGTGAASTTIKRTGGTATQNGNGVGVHDFATITSLGASPVPNMTPTTLNYCQNDDIIALAGTGTGFVSMPPASTVVRWYTDAGLSNPITSLNPPNGPGGNGIRDITTNPLLNQLGFVTTLPGTIVRYVTQSPAGGCESAPTTLTLNVQAKPVSDLIITGGSNSLCTNYVNGVANHETVQFTASPSGAATYNFRINGISTQNSASRVLNRNASNFTTGNTVDVIVTVAGSCPSTSNAIVMTKNVGTSAVDFVLASPPSGTPNTSTSFSNQSAPVALSGSPAGGVFSGPGISGNNFYPGGVPLGTHTITYTVTTGGCTGIKTKDFEVYEGTSAFTGLAASYCSTDAPIVLAVNSKPGYTFLYALPQNYYSGVLPPPPPYPPNVYPSPPFLPLGSVTAGNGTQVIAPYESAILLPPYPPKWWNGFPPGGSSPAVAATYTSSPITINPAAITQNGTVTRTVHFFGAYYNNTTLAVEFRDQDVTFYAATPVPTVSLASGYCLGGPSILPETVSVISGTTGVRWYNDPGLSDERTTLAGNISPTLLDLGISVAGPATHLRYVTQTLPNGCESAPRTVTINVYDKPTEPIAPSPPSICSGGAFSNVSVTGTNVQWYTIYPTNPINPPNPLLVSATELSVPNTNLTASPITINRYVTQTINGCASDPTVVSFIIKDNPNAPTLLPSTLTYCLTETIPNSDLAVSGSNLRWYRNATLSNEILPIANSNNPTTTELGLNTIAPSQTLFYITQTVNGCQSPSVTLTVDVVDLPTVNFTSSVDLSAVCQSGSLIDIQAFPSGGTWSGPGSAALINTNIPAGTTQLNPAALAPNLNFDLTYSFVSACANDVTQTISVFPTVSPSVLVGDACAGAFVDIQNTSSIIPNGTGTTIDMIGYRFGDGDELAPGLGTISPGTHSGNTKGTYDHPAHRFKAVGQFQMDYTMTTSDGCVVTSTRPIQVSQVPVVDFSWKNSCLDGNTEFQATITNGVNVPNGNYTWNFNKSNQLGISSSGTGSNPNVIYSTIGRDSVRLIVSSIANCKDTIQKPVFIVPIAQAITSNSPYSEDFNSSDGGWIAGGKKSSWEHGTPNSIVINRDSSSTGNGGAWKTNLLGSYNANEQSWVLSPCFDFTNASKPVISFDIWSNTPRGVDGAVLQYNITGNIENDANWIRVGQVGTGINWYDQNNISSKPGNQSNFDAGWTGDDVSTTRYKSWNRATFALDGLVGQSSVNFRIAFGATVSAGEGFAFDNVLIGERTRTVLIENFTNSSSNAGQAARLQNEKYNSFKNNSTELVKIQYHTSFPGNDPINQQRKDIYDARSAFYGLTSAPAARLDGLYKDGPFTTWGEPFYDGRVLDPTFLRIESVDAQKVDGVVRINTKLLATGPVPKNLFVHTVIVEKEITDASLLGENGDSKFLYVVRKMLPSPVGHKISTPLAAGETYDVPEILWDSENFTTPGNGAIVVFVQQDTITSKAVYQSLIVMNPPEPDLVTGIEESSNMKELMAVYPNPVDAELTIQLPYLSRQDVVVKLADPMGKIVYDNIIPAGESTKTINTRNLTGGIYLLQIESGKGNVAYRKVMVVHNK